MKFSKMLTSLTLSSLMLSSKVIASSLPNNFIHTIHLIETGGRLGPIRGTHGELGPLQIRYTYWKDSGITHGTFEDCSKLDYSAKVVEKYLLKYCGKNCKNPEILSRIHNGGPRGQTKQATIKYWRKYERASRKF